MHSRHTRSRVRSVNAMTCHIVDVLLSSSYCAGAPLESRVRADHGGHLRGNSLGFGAGADCGNHKWKGPSSVDEIQVSLP